MEQYILLIFIALGYLCGSIPFGYIISKIKKIDITKQGSGNIGATNVSRALGFKCAFLVAFLDVIKALLPIYIASHYISNEWFMVLVMMSTSIGHIFPVWLKFKGGKAVSTVFSSILYILNWKAFVFLALWAIMLKLIKIMSLTNLIIILLIPILFWTESHSIPYVSLGIIYILIIYWSHRENIKRLLKGEEKRVVK